MIAPYSIVSFLAMLQIHTHAFGRAMHSIGQLSGLAKGLSQAGNFDAKKHAVGGDDGKHISGIVRDLLVEAKNLDTPLAVITLERLVGLIESDDCTVDDLCVLTGEAERRLYDELSVRFVFSLDAKSADIFRSGSFGDDVAIKFPGVIGEISETYKCYAVGRGTAAAFHAIRCLESGFAAMWRCLGVADPISGFERNWKNRSEKIKDQVESKWPAKTGRMSGDAKFFDEAFGAVTAMQNPYRNATMHFDAKYTLEEAWHIMELVKGFMQKIASRMDENGLPLA